MQLKKVRILICNTGIDNYYYMSFICMLAKFWQNIIHQFSGSFLWCNQEKILQIHLPHDLLHRYLKDRNIKLILLKQLPSLSSKLRKVIHKQVLSHSNKGTNRGKKISWVDAGAKANVNMEEYRQPQSHEQPCKVKNSNIILRNKVLADSKNTQPIKVP